jgi:hypothetical protein
MYFTVPFKFTARKEMLKKTENATEHGIVNV